MLCFMGSWAKSAFGRGQFNDVGIIVAGTNSLEFEKAILDMFDEVVSSKDRVYHAHLVRKGKGYYPVVTNVYGAPALVDVLTEMHDGGCRTVIFVGYAYGGFKNLEIGTVVIPTKAYHFDGIYHPIDPNKKFGLPDKELKDKIESLFKKNKITFVEGVNISVPAVTFQMPHANEHYNKIKPTTVEMELASCYSRANDIGVRALGILIISDNKKTSIDDYNKRHIRTDAKKTVLQLISKNIGKIKLSHLKLKKDFKVDDYLANVIHDPKDETNVYKNKNH